MGEARTVYAALLRGVNVGGSTMLSMKLLAAVCTAVGLEDVRTYIQSGNVLFRSALSEAETRRAIEAALQKETGRKIDVLVRGRDELERVHAANPFADADPKKTMVAFCEGPVSPALLEGVVAPDGEEVRLGERALYIHFPNGMGRSKLKFPETDGISTTRNANTVAKLVALAGELAGA